jgi:hypothetical protein
MRSADRWSPVGTSGHPRRMRIAGHRPSTASTWAARAAWGRVQVPHPAAAALRALPAFRPPGRASGSGPCRAGATQPNAIARDAIGPDTPWVPSGLAAPLAAPGRRITPSPTIPTPREAPRPPWPGSGSGRWPPSWVARRCRRYPTTKAQRSAGCTATNRGASIGTALAGSILIAGLTSSFLTGVEQNPALPDTVKAHADVELAGGVPFISDADLQAALDQADVARRPPPRSWRPTSRRHRLSPGTHPDRYRTAVPRLGFVGSQQRLSADPTERRPRADEPAAMTAKPSSAQLVVGGVSHPPQMRGRKSGSAILAAGGRRRAEGGWQCLSR